MGATKDKVKGPAPHFPSIEKTYGQPLVHWTKVHANARPLTHMDRVAWMKTQRAMGHGHANALVARHMAQPR